MGRFGIDPNVYTYSAAISASEEGGQWTLALALLAAMLVVRMFPNKLLALINVRS